MIQDFTNKTKQLIDGLKAICANVGLGNDGNEYKIIIQVFLYKFMNDKFVYELRKIKPELTKANNFIEELNKISDSDYDFLIREIGAKTAKLKKHNLLQNIALKQDKDDFSKIFDENLRDIAILNNDIFAVQTGEGAKVELFEEISKFIDDSSARNGFCKAITNKLTEFSFEHIFSEKFDFFATIFEYLIKDYNKDGGGKYAEYYTPHSVAKIMAEILVDDERVNLSCYDPSAGSGQLLMNLAHKIGEDKCTIYSQDISQKSSSMLRLNLILNGLSDSISNIIKGNTISKPFHRNSKTNELLKFDYIVSNPPFKLDFSDYRDDLENDANKQRFFAGVPSILKKEKEKMAIYLLFLQHIIFSLKENGKAAIVVPTGFITAQSGIEKKIRQKIIDEKMLKGVISMPSNIFATTGTNVSVIFLDKGNVKGDVVLMDASKLGQTIKEDKNQKTVLSETDEKLIIDIFKRHQAKEDLSVVVSCDEIKEKNYSFSAGQYFDVKIEYVDISKQEFDEKMRGFEGELKAMFKEGKEIEDKILQGLKGVGYE